MNLNEIKIEDVRENLLANEITCEDLVNEYVLKAKDNKYNEYITLNIEDAMVQAKNIDEKIKNKEEIGRLAGVVISVKDNIITKDLKTTAGSKMLEDFIPPYDANIIEKIKNEDGIIIGKTNLSEFSLTRSSNNEFYGRVINPLDENLLIGGSTSGGAATLLGNSAMIALGSDTGGSIRQPASYNNLVGLKPSYGRISRYGLVTLSDSMDSVGILSKNVRDSFYMLNVLSGEDEKDANTIASNEIDLENVDTKGMKVAVLKEFILANSSRENITELNKAITSFKNKGVEVVEVSIPMLDSVLPAYDIIYHSDVCASLGRYDGIRYGYRADEYDSLEDLYKKSRKEGLGDEAKKRILYGTYLLSQDRGREYYDKALQVRGMLIEEFNELFKNFDVIIGLSSSMNSRGVDDVVDNVFKENETLFLATSNLLGLPSISVPSASKEAKIGIQFISNRFEEDKLYKIANAYEGMVNNEL